MEDISYSQVEGTSSATNLDIEGASLVVDLDIEGTSSVAFLDIDGTLPAADLDNAGNVPRDGNSIPEIGMKFPTDEEALKFYNNYAFEVGFSVRKNLVRRNKSNIPTWRVFMCSREGQTPARPLKDRPKFQRLEHRIGCNAHMEIKICKEGIYKVTFFDPKHNHETTTPAKTKLMFSHKKLNEGQKAMGDLANAVGIRPKDTYELLAIQAGGRRHLTFLPDDYKNYLRTKRQKDMALGDAGALMQLLEDKRIVI